MTIKYTGAPAWNATMTECPACGKDLTGMKQPSWHFYEDHEPSDFGLDNDPR